MSLKIQKRSKLISTKKNTVNSDHSVSAQALNETDNGSV